MESWRGRGRRAGHDALARLAAAWKAGSDTGGHPAGGSAALGRGSDGLNGIGGAGMVRDDGGSDAAMMPEQDRIARGPGVQEQIDRGAEVREQNHLNVQEQSHVSSPEPAPVTVPEPAPVTVADHRVNMAEHNRVPSWLQTGAAWSWRLLLLAAIIYLVTRLLGVLYIVVVPCVAALLLTALLQPLADRLSRAGLPRLAATWVTLLIAAAVLGGLVTLIANRVSADYPTLLAEARHTTTQVESWLSGPPFHVKNSNVQKFLNNIPGYLSKHKSLVEGTVVTGGKIASEFFGGLVLMLFVTFFLIKDGERIWNWLLGAMRTETARRMDRAGHAAWLAVVYYMRGTVAVAAIHAIVIGLVLTIMGVPLALPLAVLVFLAAFVPLVGLLVAGALAIMVTLATKGWVDALILLGILILEDQLEAHLLQPQVVGRVIRLHPLAVILSLAVGGVLAGIPGAVVAVPIVAVITRALPELRGRESGDLGPDDP
jgi:predicted PurR-regulated permease PerM